MTVTIGQLAYNGVGSGGTSINTSSVTPGSSRLVILMISAYRLFNSSPFAATGVTGCGLTWHLLASIHPTGAWDRLDIFYSMGASPTTGTPAVAYAGTNSSHKWLIFEADGVDTSGTDGSGAIVQHVEGGTTGTTSQSVSLSALGSSSNMVVGLCAQVATAATFTAASGYSWLHTEPTYTNDNTGNGNIEYEINGSTSLSFSSNKSGDIFLCGIEIKAAASSGTTSTMASTLPPVTAALTAAEKFPSTIGSTLAHLTASLTVAEKFLPSIAATLQHPTAALTVHKADFGAQVASTLAHALFSGTAAEAFPATVASTLQHPTAALTAAEAFAASIDAQLAAEAAALTGKVFWPAPIASTLQHPTASLNVSEAFSAQIASELARVAAALVVHHGIFTTIASQLAMESADVEVTWFFDVVVASTLQHLTGDLQVGEAFDATVAAVLARLVMSADAAEAFDATVASQLVMLTDEVDVTQGATASSIAAELVPAAASLDVNEAFELTMAASLIQLSAALSVRDFFGGSISAELAALIFGAVARAQRYGFWTRDVRGVGILVRPANLGTNVGPSTVRVRPASRGLNVEPARRRTGL